MVVILNIANYDIHHILVNNESLMNVLFYNAILKMNISFKWLEKLDVPITGFSVEPILV